MFTTLLTHAKTLVLGGSVLCGGAYGAHSYIQNHHNHRPDTRNTAPGHIEQPLQQGHPDRFDSRWHNNFNDRSEINRSDNNRLNDHRFDNNHFTPHADRR